MLSIGKCNRLVVARETPQGLYLNDAGGEEVLLPFRYTRNLRIGDEVDVFVYMDSEDRPVAATDIPFAMADEFACLRVVSKNERAGAFLEWGLAKDLLLPFREQVGEVRIGQKVIVYIYLDKKTSRLVASMRTRQHLRQPGSTYQEGVSVSFMVAEQTDLGYNVIVENKHTGLLYSNGTGRPLALGEKLKGFVHRVRPDGKIDLRLEEVGYQRVIPFSETVLQAIKAQGGRIPFDDKSSPESIRKTFDVSKNTFKLALSALYRDRKVVFKNGGTEWTEEGRKAVDSEWKPGAQ